MDEIRAMVLEHPVNGLGERQGTQAADRSGRIDAGDLDAVERSTGRARVDGQPGPMGREMLQKLHRGAFSTSPGRIDVLGDDRDVHDP